MQGVSLITDASGQPAVLTIDLRSVPADATPLLEALLTRVQHDAECGERLEKPRQPERKPRKAGSLAGRGSLPADFNETDNKPNRQGGSMAGEVWMADDFNAPLDDLNGYM